MPFKSKIRVSGSPRGVGLWIAGVVFLLGINASAQWDSWASSDADYYDLHCATDDFSPRVDLQVTYRDYSATLTLWLSDAEDAEPSAGLSTEISLEEADGLLDHGRGDFALGEDQFLSGRTSLAFLHLQSGHGTLSLRSEEGLALHTLSRCR